MQKESITKEKFHLFPDETTKLTSCREPNDSEKHNLCSQSDLNMMKLKINVFVLVIQKLLKEYVFL